MKKDFDLWEEEIYTRDHADDPLLIGLALISVGFLVAFMVQVF